MPRFESSRANASRVSRFHPLGPGHALRIRRCSTCATYTERFFGSLLQSADTKQANILGFQRLSSDLPVQRATRRPGGFGHGTGESGTLIPPQSFTPAGGPQAKQLRLRRKRPRCARTQSCVRNLAPSCEIIRETVMTERPPNILFLMSDQMSALALSTYAGRGALTPHLNALKVDHRRGGGVVPAQCRQGPGTTCLRFAPEFSGPATVAPWWTWPIVPVAGAHGISIRIPQYFTMSGMKTLSPTWSTALICPTRRRRQSSRPHQGFSLQVHGFLSLSQSAPRFA